MLSSQQLCIISFLKYESVKVILLKINKINMLVVPTVICIYTGHVIAGSFRVSLFIDLGCPRDLGKGWGGDLGTFMIRRPI